MLLDCDFISVVYVRLVSFYFLVGVGFFFNQHNPLFI